MHHKNGVRDDNRLRNHHPAGQRLCDMMQPLVDAYQSGDTEHQGIEVAAAMVYFCRTGKVKTDWQDVPGPLLSFAEEAE